MVRTHEATEALRRAQARLADWKSRVVDARDLAQQVGSDARDAATPFLQELSDRCDHAENMVLQLQKLEGSWHDARAGVDRSFAELERSWEAIVRVLSPSRACPFATLATWPF